MGLKLIELVRAREGVAVDEKSVENEFDGLLEEAEAGATRSNEIEFVSDMRANFDKWSVNVFCSEKQYKWLLQIAGRPD